MGKTKTKGVPMSEGLIAWLIGLEGQGALVSRNHVIRKPEWPFAVRVMADSKTDDMVLVAGCRVEAGVVVGGQPVAAAGRWAGLGVDGGWVG